MRRFSSSQQPCCSRQSCARPSPSPRSAGTPISREDLEKHVKPKLIEIDNQRYEALSEGLDEMISEQLIEKEAKSRNVTTEQLVATEITAKIPGSDRRRDPEGLRRQQGAAAGSDPRSGEAAHRRVPEAAEGGAERQQAFIEELKKKYPTTVALKPPVVSVATAGRPERGAANAPVTIIAFSDYECPFCKRAHTVVERGHEDVRRTR